MQIHSTRSKLMLLLVTTGYLLFSFVIIEYLHSNYLRNAEADNYQRLSDVDYLYCAPKLKLW
ncbi:hypothetical protein [Shewanella frigidimarina]|uniref:Uncharacterized protein n=1 Tax=Shewanella frigidimarina TaxID=56812 RepID=A0A125BEZ5_SHEFR|nr:hypothetical protein [Shewanella frigidimarina]KVX03368.1 hypothetical protein AWJ07_02030 [Shewanella frigidimarina]